MLWYANLSHLPDSWWDSVFGSGVEVSIAEWLNCAGGGMSLVRIECGLRCILQGLGDVGINGQPSAHPDFWGASTKSMDVVWPLFDDFISWVSVNEKEIRHL